MSSVLLLIVVIALAGFLVVFLGRAATLVGVVAVLTYKATLTSIFSCSIEDVRLFRAMQATDFIFVTVVVLTVLATSAPLRASLFTMRTLLSRNMLLVSLLLGFGAILGILLNPFDHFAIYLRLLAYPVMLWVIGMWLARTLDLRVAGGIVLAVLFPAALFVYMEFFQRAAYHDFISSSCYQSLRLGQASHWYRLDDVLLFSNIRLFNVEIFGDIVVAKPYGVTLNYPSTSYLLMLGFLGALLAKRYVIGVMFIGALLMMTTKASLFMLLSLMIVPWLVVRFTQRLRTALVWGWLLGFGTLATAWLMLTGRNLHAYSLLASLSSVPTHPFGNGIGWGGSLSVQDVRYTWDSAMLVGDSGLAILLNMLGFGGFVVFLLYSQLFVREAISAPHKAMSRERLLVAAFGIGVAGNAILQELAVGPYAIGVAMMMLAIAQHDELSRTPQRAVTAYSPPARRMGS